MTTSSSSSSMRPPLGGPFSPNMNSAGPPTSPYAPSDVWASEIAMPFPTYAMGWARTTTSRPGLLALGSFIPPHRPGGGGIGGVGTAAATMGAGGMMPLDNKLCVVEHDQLGDPARISSVAEASHCYPITKIHWAPAKTTGHASQWLATSGDYLRVWRLGAEDNILSVEAVLANQAKPDMVAPLTSFDWNEDAPHLAVTCSIDTTCTVWDVQASQAKTQLIAHDREVFDVGFAPGTSDIFASVGADGSVRLFDLRALEHSTIIYEHPQSAPLLRVAWNRQDPNYMAVIAYESHTISVLDVRLPSVAVAELHGHTTCVNAAAWHPRNSGHLVSGGDDGQVLVWDVGQPTRLPASASAGAPGGAAAAAAAATSGTAATGAGGNSSTSAPPPPANQPTPQYSPILAHVPHPSGAEVENLTIAHQSDWVAVTCSTQVKLLRL